MSRRSEIEIMKYVGATNWFIRGPMLLEGMIIGVVAAGCALGICAMLYIRFCESFGDQVNVINSLLADGCPIEGTVENSVLFRGVKIAPDAHVKNCVIMQYGQVHSGAYIENCILDKQAVIKRNAKLIGPEAYPIVIGKNVII